MRIGLVCPYSFDEPGGVQAHIIDLADELIRAGHEVGVLGPASQDVELPSYVTRGGPAIPIRYNGSVARLAIGPHVLKVTRRFLNEGRFDVLHIHEPNSPSYSMNALYLATGPVVATYHASATESRALSLFLPLMRPYLEKISAGIAVSELARRWQVEKLGADPVLIPNGVDTQRFRRARREAEEAGLTGSAGPGQERPVEIVFLGRLSEPRKGLGILLRAIEKMHRPARITVIGGGEHPAVSGVDFVGRVSDEEKAQILGRADIYVAPNTGRESFGIVLVEAMAAGCAVVASDIEAFAAVCDATSEHPAGRMFPMGSSSHLAVVLDELIDDPDQRKELAEAGRRRAHRYDWSRVAADVMAVYETVLDGSQHTPVGSK